MFSSFSSVEGKLLLRKRPCLKEQRYVDEKVGEAGEGNFHLNKKKYYHEMGNKLGDLFRLPPSSSSLSIWKQTLAALIFDPSVSLSIFHLKLLLLLKIENLIFIH